MTISGTTRITGIFGDPVAHSLSPRMQNAALQAAGIDAVYVPFHVTSTQLRDAVRAIRTLGLLGVNLTIPHKESALPFLDEIAPEAALIGAVNTVVNRDGRLIGCNTDGPGLVRALREDLDQSPAGKRVLLLGAGGAARAAVVALAQAGAVWIAVANRTPKRAVDLLSELSPKLTGTAFAALPLDAGLVGRLDEGVDLVVNCSAVGLKGERFPLPVETCLRSGGAVYDMVYGHQSTPLVTAAKAAGFAATDGLGMLVGQGEEAFRLWFGDPPPAGIMRAALSRPGNEK